MSDLTILLVGLAICLWALKGLSELDSGMGPAIANGLICGTFMMANAGVGLIIRSRADRELTRYLAGHPDLLDDLDQIRVNYPETAPVGFGQLPMGSRD